MFHDSVRRELKKSPVVNNALYSDVVRKNCKNMASAPQYGVSVNRSNQVLCGKGKLVATNVNIMKRIAQPYKRKTNVVAKVDIAKRNVNSAFCGAK